MVNCTARLSLVKRRIPLCPKRVRLLANSLKTAAGIQEKNRGMNPMHREALTPFGPFVAGLTALDSSGVDRGRAFAAPAPWWNRARSPTSRCFVFGCSASPDLDSDISPFAIRSVGAKSRSHRKQKDIVASFGELMSPPFAKIIILCCPL